MSDLVAAFGRHESFYPRPGWLSKAVQVTAAVPALFGDDYATVHLGVGKNMVRAIRYWGTATKVVEDHGQRGGGARVRPTPFGAYLLGDGGVDSYCEDPSTLWLLHWQLLSWPVTAPAWWWAFNRFDLLDFDGADMTRELADWVDSHPAWRIASASIKGDVSCLLQMYGRREDSRSQVDSAFSALGLLDRIPGSRRRWQFVYGPKVSLRPEVLVIASILFMRTIDPTARTVSIARLAAEAGGPGRAFKLGEGVLAASLRDLAESYSKVVVALTAGLPQLVLSGDPEEMVGDLLERLYDRRPGTAELAQLLSQAPREPAPATGSGQ